MLREQVKSVDKVKETFKIATRLTNQPRRMALAKAAKMIRK